MAEDRAVQPIKVLVVDDEPLSRRNVLVLLEHDPGVVEVTECGSGMEAIAIIRRTQPDVVFLDVQMPECDGFDVLEMLGRDQPRAVVFITAHDEYALRAFEAGALDYLMKPFDDARFYRALHRARERLAGKSADERRFVDRLIVKSRGRVDFVKAADIDWIEAASCYACLHVGQNTHILRRTLTELERDLDTDKFIRVHRSAIVNLERVRGFETESNGEFAVVLDGGTRLPVSRRCRKLVQDRMATVSREAR